MKKYEYTIQGVDYKVEIVEVEGSHAKVNVNGVNFDVEMKTPISIGKQVVKPSAKKPTPVPVKGEAPKKDSKTEPVQAGEGAKVISPLPGMITSVNVKVGDAVAVGDTVVVLEAMKMQNNIETETAGTVTSVMVGVGESVMEGTVLVTVA